MENRNIDVSVYKALSNVSQWEVCKEPGTNY